MELTYPMDIGRHYPKGVGCLGVNLFVIFIYWPG
jgi:hypothetical protein